MDIIVIRKTRCIQHVCRAALDRIAFKMNSQIICRNRRTLVGSYFINYYWYIILYITKSNLLYYINEIYHHRAPSIHNDENITFFESYTDTGTYP